MSGVNSGQKIPVIIVGSGHGLRVHLPALRQVGFEVVGLVGRDPDRTRRRAEKHDIPHAFTDLSEAIKTTGAVAVSVASTPANHGTQVGIAIEHGCHVMCEKPFARDAAEAERLVAAAEAAGIVHILGNQLRAMPERIVAAQAIADGLIGEPRYLTFVQHIAMLSDTATPWPDWWFDDAAGGGWLGASGSHMIDQIRSWLGDFASLSAALQVVADRDTATEDTYSVHFTLRNGVGGVFTQTASAWGPMAQMTRVCGTQGTLWLDKGEVFLADKNGVHTLPIPDELRLSAIEPSEDPRKRFLHVELPPTLKLFECWRRAIEQQRSVAPFANFHDGLAAMRVIDAIRQSASAGGALVQIC